MPATLNETCQACGVQGDLGVAAIVGLQPGMLQAGGGCGPAAKVFLQDDIDEIPCSVAHATEVLMGEAEIHSADVDACLFFALIQKWGDPTQHDIGQNPNAPDVCAQGDWNALDHFWGGKLWVPQQVVDVEMAWDLDSILQVDEFHPRHWDPEVNE